MIGKICINAVMSKYPLCGQEFLTEYDRNRHLHDNHKGESMRNDLTELILIVDRSGSMSALCESCNVGIAKFIDEHTKAAGEALLTVVLFDDKIETPIRSTMLSKDKPLSVTISPRGWTALYDAVGKTLSEVEERHKHLPPPVRPGLTIVTIVTDGLENASKEYKQEQIRDMQSRLEKEPYNWQFQFLGANFDVKAEAANIGIVRGSVGEYETKTSGGILAAYTASSSNAARMRQANLEGLRVSNNYTPEEIKLMAGEKE